MPTIEELDAAYNGARHVASCEPSELGPLERRVKAISRHEEDRVLCVVWRMPSGAYCGLYAPAGLAGTLVRKGAAELARCPPRWCGVRVAMEGGGG